MVLKDKLKIWQQNINKSPTCQHDLLSSDKLTKMDIDIVALQEPAINHNNLTIAAKDWITVYPSMHSSKPESTRAIILICAQISTETWNQLEFPSGDVTVVQLCGSWGKLTIFNVYNEGTSSNTINLLTNYHRDNRLDLKSGHMGTAHIIWLGDFNRHHPAWDNPSDVDLFSGDAIHEVEMLIEAVAEVGLISALPHGMPMHCHHVTKCWSRLDQVFISEHSENMLTACEALTGHRGINTDHLPICTELGLNVVLYEQEPALNLREVDWEEFRRVLDEHLLPIYPDKPITNQITLDQHCGELTRAIQRAIRITVPISSPAPNHKCWWTKELTQLRKLANKLGRKSYGLRNLPEHSVHTEHREAKRLYDSTLCFAKRQHWRDWLKRAKEPDIWTANRYVSTPASDGEKARIPILRHTADSQEAIASSNKKKSCVLAKAFFPPGPQGNTTVAAHKYPAQCQGNIRITAEQIRSQLHKIKPFKALEPDGIPNVVLTKCADRLTDRLLSIYGAIFKKGLSYEPWKQSTTVVLRKPGKPKYDVPKAYRPIALLNTMWKVLTAIVADHLTFVTETHQLLPANHFGGRPGRTTTDAMHLLANTIKASWRVGQVTAALFLDIEGAFPNAVPVQLLHNLRKHRVPRRITNFVSKMLTSRVTMLKFDRYTSEPMVIDNSIGQEDLLSMGLYQYYNADLLNVPRNKGELALAYIDDASMIATADTFAEAHDMLADMMTRAGGVNNWSVSHNSPLEYSKLALIDFPHSSSAKERLPLQLPQRVINPSVSTKYLRVIFDQNLS